MGSLLPMANKFHTCSLRCILCQVHALTQNVLDSIFCLRRKLCEAFDTVYRTFGSVYRNVPVIPNRQFHHFSLCRRRRQYICTFPFSFTAAAAAASRFHFPLALQLPIAIPIPIAISFHFTFPFPLDIIWNHMLTCGITCYWKHRADVPVHYFSPKVPSA